MDIHSLQEQIYDWLGANYPEGPQWHVSGFHCFKDCDPIIRQVVAMDAVEGEIANGAWGQLLWNTFPNWRTVLTLASEGYLSMEAKKQYDSIAQLKEKFSEHEMTCHEAILRASSGNFNEEFGAFTSIGYSDTSFQAQMTFLDENLPSSRGAWLERNRNAVISAISA